MVHILKNESTRSFYSNLEKTNQNLWNGYLSVCRRIYAFEWRKQLISQITLTFYIRIRWKCRKDENSAWNDCKLSTRTFSSLEHPRHGVLKHLTYSTDLIPCDFLLLHTVMNHLKGFHLETVKEMAIVKNLQGNDFWKLATMLEFMCNCRRELLWSRLL